MKIAEIKIIIEMKLRIKIIDKMMIDVIRVVNWFILKRIVLKNIQKCVINLSLKKKLIIVKK